MAPGLREGWRNCVKAPGDTLPPLSWAINGLDALGDAALSDPWKAMLSVATTDSELCYFSFWDQDRDIEGVQNRTPKIYSSSLSEIL